MDCGGAHTVHDKADFRIRRRVNAALLAARRRLDWTHDRTRYGADAQRATIARTLAILFGAGATLLLITLALPQAGPEDRNELALIAAAAAAYLAAGGLLIAFARTPMWVLSAAPAVGSLVIGVVIAFAGS